MLGRQGGVAMEQEAQGAGGSSMPGPLGSRHCWSLGAGGAGGGIQWSRVSDTRWTLGQTTNGVKAPGEFASNLSEIRTADWAVETKNTTNTKHGYHWATLGKPCVLLQRESSAASGLPHATAQEPALPHPRPVHHLLNVSPD